MSDVAWLVVALAAVGIGIGSYIASIVLRRRSLERRLAELEHGDRDRG